MVAQRAVGSVGKTRVRGRLTAGLYGGLATVLVIAVVVVAYGTQSPSLGVAEFAPAARQDVTTPPSTASNAATRAGRDGRGRTTTTTPPATTPSSVVEGAATAPTTRVARSRQCYGNPPRQTEDPQSPPCLAAIFEGDNGGATSRGVTSTEIAVAVPLACCEAVYKPVIQALFDYANQQFEFYGRRLRPVFVSGGASDPTQSRAAAANIAAQQVFGALSGDLEWNWTLQDAFYQELARAGIVTIARGMGKLMSDRTLFDALHPYLWSVAPSVEDYSRNVANFVCRALIDRPAAHAGDAALRSQTRRFGLIVHGHARLPSSTALRDALDEGCSVQPARMELVAMNDSSGSQRRAAIDAFKAGGVTTVICLCEGSTAPSDVSTATTAGYQPEWIVSTTHDHEDENAWQATTERPIIPISEHPKEMPTQARFWFRVLTSTAPQLLAGNDAPSAMGLAEVLYPSLLVLASGIQGAGPALTAGSFAAALMAMDFPNPTAGQAPFWQQRVGFGAGDHGFYDDYVVRWWSLSAPVVAPFSTPGRGSWCYLGQGARYSVGTYPADADNRLFNPTEPCR